MGPSKPQGPQHQSELLWDWFRAAKYGGGVPGDFRRKQDKKAEEAFQLCVGGGREVGKNRLRGKRRKK